MKVEGKIIISIFYCKFYFIKNKKINEHFFFVEVCSSTE